MQEQLDPKKADVYEKKHQKNNVVALDSLLKRPDIWRGSTDGYSLSTTNIPSIPSGHKCLDEQLYHQGWPSKALTELFCEQPGMGELSLLAPALSNLSQHNRWIFLVDPPHEPYAPALEQMGIKLSRLIIVHTESSKQYTWVCEQILRSSSYGALLAWEADKRLGQQQIRKLQLATRAQSGIAVLLRSQKLAQQHSFAALRISLKVKGQQYQLDILKQPGGWAGQRLELRRPKSLLETAPAANELPVHLPVYVPVYSPPDSSATDRFSSLTSRKFNARELRQHP